MNIKRALIVDDSATMREIVALEMINNGFEVIKAGHGKDALEKLQDLKINIIITDLNMPEMNGIQLIRALRQNPNYHGVPILIITTESSMEKKQEAKKAGATGWIVKPFEPIQFIKVVNQVCI